MDIVPQLILNSIIDASIYLLIALGFWLAYRTAKFFNLAHGAVALAGAYAVLFFTKNLGINLYPAIFLGISVSGLLGLALDKFIYLPLRKRKASNMVLLIASLGAYTVISALLAIIFTSQFQSLSRLVPDQKIYTIAGGNLTQIQLLMLLFGLIIFAGLALMLKKTKFGHAISAISDDEEVAKIVGINTNKIIGYVFFISSSIAGLAGIMVGLDTGIEPWRGLTLLLSGVVAVIIGGINDIFGVLLGCFILGFVDNFGIWKINGEWRNTITFGLLIIFLLFRPQGIIKK